jgi:hypothetical protein
VKSRRILSARAAAAGSGIVVFFHRFAARPLQALGARISRAARLRECRRPPRAARRGPAANSASMNG